MPSFVNGIVSSEQEIDFTFAAALLAAVNMDEDTVPKIIDPSTGLNVTYDFETGNTSYYNPQTQIETITHSEVLTIASNDDEESFFNVSYTSDSSYKTINHKTGIETIIGMGGTIMFDPKTGESITFNSNNKVISTGKTVVENDNTKVTQEFDLEGNVFRITTEKPNGEVSVENINVKVEKFDKWTNGEGGDNFQMFTFNAATYSTDLKNFAQEYIDKYDENKNNVLDKNEFYKMASGKTEAQLTVLEKALLDRIFQSLNLDSDENSISSSELASQYFIEDLNLDRYIDTEGDVAASLDGKLEFDDSQAKEAILPGDTGYNTLRELKLSYYNTYYRNNNT